jgi:hypothetical protein
MGGQGSAGTVDERMSRDAETGMALLMIAAGGVLVVIVICLLWWAL